MKKITLVPVVLASLLSFAAHAETPLNQVLPGGEILITDGIEVGAKTTTLWFADGGLFSSEKDIPKDSARVCAMGVKAGTRHLGPSKLNRNQPTTVRIASIVTDEREHRAVLNSDGHSPVEWLDCRTALANSKIPSAEDVSKAIGTTRLASNFTKFPVIAGKMGDSFKFQELLPNFLDRKPQGTEKHHKDVDPGYELLPNFTPGKGGAAYQLLPNFTPKTYQNL